MKEFGGGQGGRVQKKSAFQKLLNASQFTLKRKPVSQPILIYWASAEWSTLDLTLLGEQTSAINLQF